MDGCESAMKSWTSTDAVYVVFRWKRHARYCRTPPRTSTSSSPGPAAVTSTTTRCLCRRRRKHQRHNPWRHLARRRRLRWHDVWRHRHHRAITRNRGDRHQATDDGRCPFRHRPPIPMPLTTITTFSLKHQPVNTTAGPGQYRLLNKRKASNVPHA